MVATVSKDFGGNSWQTGNVRQYDVWGSVRQGNQAGDPKGRYCANLRHVQEYESGLVYIRARYYEPSTVRFISENPAMDGHNWFSYANSQPSMQCDSDGLESEFQTKLQYFFFWSGIGALAYAYYAGGPEAKMIAMAGLVAFFLFFAMDGLGIPNDLDSDSKIASFIFHSIPSFAIIGGLGSAFDSPNLAGQSAKDFSVGSRVVSAMLTYMTVLSLFVTGVNLGYF